MTITLLLTLFLSGLHAMSSPSLWTYKGTGIDMTRGQFTDDDGTKVNFALFRIDPTRRSVYILDTYKYLESSNPYSAFSLRAVQEKANAMLLSNAGSTTSYDLPSPAGLLMVNHRVVSPLDRESEGGGILCIAKAKISILPTSASTSSCVDAVQRGPLLNSSFRTRTKAWKGKAQRTVVAVDDTGNLLLLVTENAVTLDGVATYLFVNRQDLQVSLLLNLDGGGSTGMIFRARDTIGHQFVMGNVDGLVASAISIR